MKNSKALKIKVGLFAVVAGGLAALILIVFGGLRFWQHHNHYSIVFADSVMGLQRGAEVDFNGIRVGSVKSIEIAKDSLSKVQVVIEVDDDVPVRTDTTAQFKMAGLTGLKVIDLIGGSITAPPLPSGGRIAVGETTLDKLQRQAQQVVDDTSALFKHANQVVSHVDDIAASLAKVVNDTNLGAITAQTRVAATNLASASAQLNAMIAENRTALKSTIASIDAAAKGTSELVDGQVAGVVTNVNDLVSQLKDVVHADGAQLKSAMTDLKQAARTFKELTRDVKAKPSRLLFSDPESDRKMP